jgi:peptide/nickel transport system substrate-binding protein
MKRRTFATALALGAPLAGLWRPSLSRADAKPALIETPSLAERVKAGDLPPVDKRIPASPSIVSKFYGSDGAGQHGGECNMLIANGRDTRLMTLYANTRLIVYDPDFKLQPDILESFEDKDGHQFTMKIRAGHKWSDGHPFTSEDFRYYWEDIINNSELTPGGPPVVLLVEKKPPKVEILDELTVRYTWEKPNPYFVSSQAQAAPLWLFRPAHYLKKFHIKYTSAEEIDKAAKGGQAGKWTQIHKRLDVMYNNDNPELPTLNPWKLMTQPPAQRFVYERNPFYFRIDDKGRQLPYIDRVVFTTVAANLVPAKAGLGEADLQCRYLNMRDYTFLRRSAKTSHVDVRLWEQGSCSQMALYPNLNAKDDDWRQLNRDVRFRRALSLAIDREEINESVFLGMAKPSNNTIMRRSELFKEQYATKWATHDIKQANALLDDLGLKKRDSSGFRILPDPGSIVLEYSSDVAEDTDALELIKDQLKKVGIKFLYQKKDLNAFRLRTFSGEAMMTAYAGLTTAVPTPETSPKEFAPTMLGGLQWPRWGMFIETNGKQGEKCDMPEAQLLLDQLHKWEAATNDADRRKAWTAILEAHMEHVFSIGTMNGVMQPIVVGPKVRNVPKEGYYAWDPGGYIGLYKPDTFWWQV